MEPNIFCQLSFIFLHSGATTRCIVKTWFDCMGKPCDPPGQPDREFLPLHHLHHLHQPNGALYQTEGTKSNGEMPTVRRQLNDIKIYQNGQDKYE